MRTASRRHQGRCRGQSLVELTMILPLLLVLAFGVWAAASFLSDRQVAGQAARAGARLGAEIGNNGYVTGQSALAGSCQTVTGAGNDPCTVDAQIISTVLTTGASLVNTGGITEVDIYKPCNLTTCLGTDTGKCSAGTSGIGTAYVSGEPADIYTRSGGVLTRSGTAGYTLDMRSQAHPNETVVGVRVVYTFTSPSPMKAFNMQTSESAVMCLAPQETL